MLCGERRSKVHISDESKFNLFGSDGKHYVRRQTGERLKPKCIKKSVKMEEKLACFGRCFLQQELGLLYTFMSGWMQMFIRNSFSNMQFLHCKHLPISQQWSWQYSCHTAEWVKQFLEAENIEIMKWLGQCPGLKINNISEKNQVFIDYSLIWSPLYLRWWSWSWRDVIVLKARSRFIQCYSGVL